MNIDKKAIGKALPFAIEFIKERPSIVSKFLARMSKQSDSQYDSVLKSLYTTVSSKAGPLTDVVKSYGYGHSPSMAGLFVIPYALNVRRQVRNETGIVIAQKEALDLNTALDSVKSVLIDFDLLGKAFEAITYASLGILGSAVLGGGVVMANLVLLAIDLYVLIKLNSVLKERKVSPEQIKFLQSLIAKLWLFASVLSAALYIDFGIATALLLYGAYEYAQALGHEFDISRLDIIDLMKDIASAYKYIEPDEVLNWLYGVGNIYTVILMPMIGLVVPIISSVLSFLALKKLDKTIKNLAVKAIHEATKKPDKPLKQAIQVVSSKRSTRSIICA